MLKEGYYPHESKIAHDPRYYIHHPVEQMVAKAVLTVVQPDEQEHKIPTIEIVGPTGSGRTTLLEHIAATYVYHPRASAGESQAEAATPTVSIYYRFKEGDTIEKLVKNMARTVASQLETVLPINEKKALERAQKSGDIVSFEAGMARLAANGIVPVYVLDDIHKASEVYASSFGAIASGLTQPKRPSTIADSGVIVRSAEKRTNQLGDSPRTKLTEVTLNGFTDEQIQTYLEQHGVDTTTILDNICGSPMLARAAVEVAEKGIDPQTILPGLLRKYAEELVKGLEPGAEELLKSIYPLRWIRGGNLPDILLAMGKDQRLSPHYWPLSRHPITEVDQTIYALKVQPIAYRVLNRKVINDDPDEFQAAHEKAVAYYDRQIGNIDSMGTYGHLKRAELERLQTELDFHRAQLQFVPE